MFKFLIDRLKAQPRKIVFTEGTDARILEAAARLLKDGLLSVILVGNVDEVKAAAAKGGFDIAGAEIIDPDTYADIDKMVETMVTLRKGKVTPAGRRYILHRRHGPPRPADRQDQARQQHRLFLHDHDPGHRGRGAAPHLHGRPRHQHLL